MTSPFWTPTVTQCVQRGLKFLQYVGSSEDQRLCIRKCISDFYGLRLGIIHGRRRGNKDPERASQDRKRALQVKTYDIAKATVLEHLKRGHMPGDQQ